MATTEARARKGPGIRGILQFIADPVQVSNVDRQGRKGNDNSQQDGHENQGHPPLIF